MKKIFAAAVIASMIAAMGVSAFAENDNDVSTEDLTAVNETVSVAPSYAENKVKSVEENKITLEDGTEIETENIIVLNLNGEILAASDIKEDNVIRFYSENNTVIDITGADEKSNSCVIDEFKKSETLGDYVDSANNLAINASDDMEIIDFEGNKRAVSDIEGSYIAVFYNMTTMSIPAITNPKKVVILGGAPMILPETEADPIPETTPEASPEFTIEPAETENVNFTNYDLKADEIKTIDGINMLPLRKIAEDLGYEVGWNGEDKSVTIGTVQMGVSLKIGENSYSKSKMTPFVLSAAPVIINDRTYVPADFFEEVLETIVNIVIE